MKVSPIDFLELSEQPQSASSPTAYLKTHSAKSPLLKKNINKVFQGKVDEDNLRQSFSIVNAQVADSLGQLLEDLNMTEQVAEKDNQSQNISDGEETEDNTLQTEMDEMCAMGLPMAFGRQRNSGALRQNR